MKNALADLNNILFEQLEREDEKGSGVPGVQET